MVTCVTVTPLWFIIARRGLLWYPYRGDRTPTVHEPSPSRAGSLGRRPHGSKGLNPPRSGRPRGLIRPVLSPRPSGRGGNAVNRCHPMVHKHLLIFTGIPWRDPKVDDWPSLFGARQMPYSRWPWGPASPVPGSQELTLILARACVL